MDPINKWLTVVIFFMAALLIVIATKAGSGRYIMTTDYVELGEPGEKHVIIYSLDTKSGAIKAKAINCQETFVNDQNEVKNYWIDNLKPWKRIGSYRYNSY